MNAEEFGERVARERLKRGMSQQTLADTLGVSRGYIAQIERGREASKDIMANLVLALGIPIDELIDFAVVREKNEALAQLMDIVSPSIQFMSENLDPGQMLELAKEQEQNEEFFNKLIDAAGSIPAPTGPNGWETLTKGDRKLVQEIINRLLKSSRYGEGAENG